MLLVLVTSCDAGEKPAKHAEQKQAVPPPVVLDASVPVASDAANVVVSVDDVRATPVGPYVVHYNCFHSNAPFGPGEQYRNTTWDLGAGTVSYQAWETNEGAAQPDVPEPPQPARKKPAPVAPKLPPKPTVSKMPADRVKAAEAAVIEVLRAGELKPEYAVPEGTPCTLQIDTGGKAIFTLEKAFQKEKDAATALLQALGGA
jgi:hypothetical protein